MLVLLLRAGVLSAETGALIDLGGNGVMASATNSKERAANRTRRITANVVLGTLVRLAEPWEQLGMEKWLHRANEILTKITAFEGEP